MPSIEFIIKANYKEVNEAYARIDALKDLVKGFKADSPEGISIVLNASSLSSLFLASISWVVDNSLGSFTIQPVKR